MASSSSSTPVRNYDVFLSFRGEDTRNNIVSYLYEALCRHGIFTFKDDQRLQAGDTISVKLVQAIKTSLFAIVIISENYANSKWCLDELLLIMELHSEKRIQVVPIFYGVEPSNVRYQTGSFEAAFQIHENRSTALERVSRWKRSLNQVSLLSGFHIISSLDQASMISSIVRSVSSQLLETRKPANWDNLVGIQSHMVKMFSLLNVASENEVLIIGIWGMGGVGKTTIAKCFYDHFSSYFQVYYFIDDIKKNYKNKSPSYLLEIFLSSILCGKHIGFRTDEAGSQEIKARLGHQKVFIVLDGVDKVEQVHALARETTWFGPGSRIIITTRDMGLLNSCGVNIVHEVKCLDDKYALQVFEKSVFGGRPPPSDRIQQLFIKASRLAHGLPSALVAYASHLSQYTTVQQWEDELCLLRKDTHKNVKEVLKYSYDNLDEQDKNAFLHVACLLNGYPLKHVTSLLDDGRPRMNHLTAKSLISISKDICINMHYLVVQTGMAIVRQESRDRPSRQRFLWDTREIYDILNNNIGSDKVEGVSLHMGEMKDELTMSNKVFSNMHSIKFLKLFHHLGGAKINVQLESDGFPFPHNLRLLHWDMYPLKTLSSRFQHDHLVELNLRYNNLKCLWDNSVILPKLRRLDVTNSYKLLELPNFSTSKDFEDLIVDGCMSLRNIPESLSGVPRLKKLKGIGCHILKGVMIGVDLSLRWVIGERTLKTTLVFQNVEMEFYFLTDLCIEGQILVKFLGFHGYIEHLSLDFKQQILPHMSNCSSSKSIELELMRFSYMKDCDPLADPFHCSSFGNLDYLAELKLINLNIQVIPNDIDLLRILEKLDLGGNDFVCLPYTIRFLSKLKYLSLRNCRKLRVLPILAQVETLILSDCVKLRELLVAEYCPTYCLLELWLDNCKGVQLLPNHLSHLPYLKYLDLSRHDFKVIPTGIKKLSYLETLFLDNCKKLRSVEVPQSLKYLYAHGCDSLEKVALSPNHSIKQIDVIHCPSLNQEEHEHMMDLFLSDGHSQEGSRQCVCLRETDVPNESNNQRSGTSTKITRLGKLVRSIKSAFRRPDDHST